MDIEKVGASELAAWDVIRVPDDIRGPDNPDWWEILTLFVEGKGGPVVLDVESVDHQYLTQWHLDPTDRVERQITAI